MGKFDGILLCTDFDGTFAMTGTVLSPDNCAAVEYFQENGGLFTIASGRSADFVLSFNGFKPNAPIVSANGTVICHPETLERLAEFPLSESAREIMDAGAQLEFARRIYICNRNGHGNVWEASSGVPIDEFYNSVEGPWYKVLFEQSAEETAGMKAWAEKTWSGKYEFSCSWSGGLEFQALGSGKGESLAHIKRLVGNIRLTIGAGDYENDVSLIRCADIGYAVANAVPEAKAAADRITVSNDEHAIARIIEDLEKGDLF